MTTGQAIGFLFCLIGAVVNGFFVGVDIVYGLGILYVILNAAAALYSGWVAWQILNGV